MLGYLGVQSRIELARERHLPSGEVELLINLGDPYKVLRSNGSNWATHREAAVIGVHDRYVLTEGTGTQHVLVVRLQPPAAHMLFDAPMHELANGFLEL